MIEFMVISAPRSGSTWAANWLTTDTSLCFHDLLSTTHYSEWDKTKSNKTLGVSDTGIGVFNEFLNNHPAKKVILHRPFEEINKSLADIGYPILTDHWNGALEKINGMHVNWLDIFDNPKPIYEYLMNKEFDPERHSELMKIEMQPQWSGLKINKDVTKRILEEIRSIEF